MLALSVPLCFTAAVLASVLAGACLLLLYTALILYNHRKYLHFPSPKLPSFYLGHIPDILRLRKERGNPKLSITDICEYWFQTAGSDTIVIYFFHQPRVFTADPEVVKKISMDSKHGKSVEFMKPLVTICGKRLLGRALVTEPNYETWLPQRKVMDRVFMKTNLDGLIPKFNHIIDYHLKKLERQADGTTAIPLAMVLQNFVLSIVCECYAEKRLPKKPSQSENGAPQPKTESIVQFYYFCCTMFSSSHETVCEHIAKRIKVPTRFASGKLKEPLHYTLTRINDGITRALFSLSPVLIPLYRPFEAKEYRDAVSSLRETIKEHIENRIEESENGKDTPSDVLSHILQLASINGVGMEELVDHYFNFFGGGFDTTLNMIQFTIALLCQHPEVMSRVKEEVHEVLGTNLEVQLSVSDVMQLTYLEKVLYESLRMYPIVPGITKCPSCDVKIKDDLIIPAKTTVLLMSSIITRKSEHFEDPEVFNPERFSPATKPNSFTFFPFGIGHRTCIGKNFALMEAKMFLAKFYQRFTVTLPGDYKLVPVQEGVTYKPRGDLICTLTSCSEY